MNTKLIFYICVTVIICVMFISCTIDDMSLREYDLELKKCKSDFEVCVDTCPYISFLNPAKNQECVDKCIEKIVLKGG